MKVTTILTLIYAFAPSINAFEDQIEQQQFKMAHQDKFSQLFESLKD
jgi:hypothetical protein